MIVTGNAMYLHLPKTAGTWVRSVLAPITVFTQIHGIPLTKPLQPHVFAFVRNPWAWYASFYHFHNHGSEIFNLEPDIIKRVLTENVSFNDFLVNVINPTPAYKKKLVNASKVQSLIKERNPLIPLVEIFTSWIDTDASLYQHMCNSYCSYATKIGMYENIRTDLLDMVLESAELTPALQDSILNCPAINITTSPIDYRMYYTFEMQELVRQSSKQLIESKQYAF